MGNTQLSDEFIEENIHLSNFVMCRKINLPQYKLTFSKLKYIYIILLSRQVQHRKRI